MVRFFCPGCWKEVDENCKICPYCGYDLSSFTSLPFEEKLLISLNHPVKEIRRRIIYFIGKKGIEKALPYFEKILEEEKDPVILFEVVDALRRFNSPQALKILEKARKHRFRIVAEYVQNHG